MTTSKTVEHHWEICLMCGPMVVCGACRNNSCNGGYGDGDGPNGKCVHCPSAYKMMFDYDKNIFNGWGYYQTKASKKRMQEAMWASFDAPKVVSS